MVDYGPNWPEMEKDLSLSLREPEFFKSINRQIEVTPPPAREMYGLLVEAINDGWKLHCRDGIVLLSKVA